MNLNIDQEGIANALKGDQPDPEPTVPTEGTIDIDGEQVPISQVKEWKQGHMRQDDYTKKTQEVAELRKLSEQYGMTPAEIANWVNETNERLHKNPDIMEKLFADAEDVSLDDINTEPDKPTQPTQPQLPKEVLNELNEGRNFRNQMIIKEATQEVKTAFPHFNDEDIAFVFDKYMRSEGSDLKSVAKEYNDFLIEKAKSFGAQFKENFEQGKQNLVEGKGGQVNITQEKPILSFNKGNKLRQGERNVNDVVFDELKRLQSEGGL